MSFINVSPAYGRDYKSQKEVQDAFDSGADFRITDYGQYQGSYLNREDAIRYGMTGIIVRYANKRKVYQVKIKN